MSEKIAGIVASDVPRVSTPTVSSTPPVSLSPVLDELKQRTLNLFGDSIEEAVALENNDDNRNRARGIIANNIGESLEVIASNLYITPIEGSGIESGHIAVETDLHGDMNAFLNTLLKAGMVEFNKNNPTGVIFYDPQNKKSYTLEELEAEKTRIGTEGQNFTELMNRIQIFPDIAPTPKYSQYVNCGDFLDRGKQSEQMIHLINYLGDQCDDRCILRPKLIVGNHEGFYIDFLKDKERFSTMLENGAKTLFSYNIQRDKQTCIKSEGLVFKKLKAMSDATRKAVEDGTLALAHNEGNTIFTHAVITRNMVRSLAERFEQLDKLYGKSGEGDKELKDDVARLAVGFKYLYYEKIDKEIPFSEDDTTKLVEALNGFNRVRVKLIKRSEEKGGKPMRKVK
ncbi:hypothetical protein FACS1894152_2510 [Bacilli bacterium]|nr:hypothetical protein FACS1894152_2510 [Bacilli bacterium]